MTKSDLLQSIIRNTDMTTEAEIISLIMSSPYKRLSKNQYDKICTEYYYPGTFSVGDRIRGCDFLFDEKQQSFFDWFHGVVNNEIIQLCRVTNFKNRLNEYGKASLILDAYNILFFCVDENAIFADLIPNQEYSDLFRRILLFLLFGDPNYEINPCESFKQLGYDLIPKVLERGEYTLKQRLCQSIYSGLIGMDIKDELVVNSPLSEEKIIRLKTNETTNEKIDRIFMALDRIAEPAIIDVDSWSAFENRVVFACEPTKICWFTDDYIPTMFEMKFIEELLMSNCNIFMTIIPRVQSYSNDASFKDVEEILSLPTFNLLRDLKKQGRFGVCRQGLDMGTFDGNRLSNECANIVLKCDYVVISGARSYETGQGIKKNCFFTGIAICRSYTETVTGVCKDDGAIFFLEQKACERSFNGFKGRLHNRKYCKLHNRWFPVADYTSLDYLSRIHTC